jgi:hypothetical protein
MTMRRPAVDRAAPDYLLGSTSLASWPITVPHPS